MEARSKSSSPASRRCESVEIAPEAAEDVDLLQDLIVAAVNDALGKANEMASERFSSLTGGIDIPGLT